jgi:uroporphyrinogen decarboxylase
MPGKISPKERLEMILAKEKPDRYAASFWRHFFHMENNAGGTVEAMVYFQKMFNWDFIKINPRADFHIEGWGFEQEWSTDEFTKHKKINFPVKSLEDWQKIKPLDISSPPLDEHLKVISQIRKQIGNETPIFMTVFSPLSTAGRMIEDKQMFVKQLKENPDIILSALEAITATFEKFSEECRNAGADAIFYATLQWASSDLLSFEEYKKFGVPYDLRVMKKAEADDLNILHVCHTNNYLKELHELNYPAAMYNWDSAHPTNLPIDKAIEIFKDKTIVGGVDHEGWLLQGNPGEIKYKIEQMKEMFDSSRFIFAPGCAIPSETPMENLQAVKESL